MPFLQIGASVIEVQTSGFSEQERTSRAPALRSFKGMLRQAHRTDSKRRWSFTTGPMDAATAAGLRTAWKTGDFFACSGDALGTAAPVNCMVEIGQSGYIATGASGHYRTFSLTLVEV